VTFRIGQRVRTTVDAPAAHHDDFSAPAGTLGTVTGLPSVLGSYGVVLDGDPFALPAAYEPDELASAE
jgi:hypothetical protein